MICKYVASHIFYIYLKRVQSAPPGRKKMFSDAAFSFFYFILHSFAFQKDNNKLLTADYGKMEICVHT